MKKFKKFINYVFVPVLFSFFLIACNDNKQETTEEKMVTKDSTDMESDKAYEAMATLSATESDTALNGTVEFVVQNGKVKMSLNISVPKMANKSVAVHLHEMGNCGDMGKDAHGHWNPTDKQHGKWGSGNFHAGDIGNISLNAQGEGSMELETDLWTIGGDAKTDILDKSVIVHSGKDDFTSQPAGNAGSRIGCGVIRRK